MDDSTPVTTAEASSETPPANQQPRVSVIVPVRNEEGYIRGCLEALAAQDYPPGWLEIIVLDGDSTDGTMAELQQAARDLALDVRCEPNPGRTTTSGFNLGLALASGDIIVKVDGHTRVAPDFISASVDALERSGADAVGGAIETRGVGPRGEAIAAALSSPFGIGGNAFRTGTAIEQWVDSVPFGAYRRDVFDRIGAFAEINRGEDDEFNYRLRAAGGRILLTPEIRSAYFCRNSFRALARQYWGYGLAKAKVLRLHPGRLRWRHLVPSALVAILAGGIVLSMLDRRFAWVVAAAGAAYGAATALAAWRSSGGDRRRARETAIAFACVHIPAGAGMLAGIAREAIDAARSRRRRS